MSQMNTVSDLGEVWLLLSKEGYAMLEIDGFAHLLAWPRKEFCAFLASKNDIPTSMEIHKFLEECDKLDKYTRFMIFPTESNSYVVTTEELCEDIREHLEQIE